MTTENAADPFLSASLFAAGHLDAAIAKVLSPLAGETPAAFYFLRYGRGVEHLKLRFFGDAGEAARLRERLEQLAAEFFASLPPAEETPAPAASQPPPIDLEDEDLAFARDRSLRLTTYRRSYVPFAGPPFLADDRLMAAAGRVLCTAGQGFAGLFSGDSAPTQKTRQNVLLRLVPLGIAAFALPAAERPVYLEYHRDWLVRWMLGAFAADQQDRLLAPIEKLKAASAASPAAFPILQGYFAADCRHFGEPLDTRLRQAFAELGAEARRIAATAAPETDPYTRDLSVLPLFKAFHMFANALGIKMRDEALAHQLLGSALAAAPLAA